MYTIIALNGAVMVLIWYSNIKIQEALVDLDTRLAAAIRKTVESLPLDTDIEPPNPMQQLIAGYLQQKLMERDESGRFVAQMREP